VAAAYFGAAKLGLALAFDNSSVTAIWPPTGVALAALLIWGRWMWPAVAVGAFLANVTTAGSVVAVLGITTGNTLEAVVGAFLLGRVGFGHTLARMRDVMALVLLAAVVSTAVSASIGVFSLWADGLLPTAGIGSTWRVWWLGDMGGDLLIAPTILVLAARPQIPWRSAWLAEAVGLTAVLTLVSAIIFPHNSPLAYAVFPLLFWTALRLRQPGAVVAGLLVSGFAVWYTAHGQGPFVTGSPDANLLRAQTFVGIATITALLVAAVRTEGQTATDAERRLAEAQQLAHLGSWEWLIASNEVSWSAELYRIYGVDPARFDASYEGFVELVHPDDREMVGEAIATAMADVAPFEFEHRIVRPDGEVRTLQARGEVLVDASGEPVAMRGTGQDITERKNDEEARVQLAAIVESSSDAIISRTLAGTIVSWNRGAEDLYGYTAEEAIGESIVLVPPERLHEVTAITERTKRGEVDPLETVCVGKDGRPIDVAVTISRTYNSAGELTGVATIARDITERKLRERYLELQHEATLILTEPNTIDEALSALLRLVGERMGWSVGAFWTPTRDGGELGCAAFWHAPSLAVGEFEAKSKSLRLAPDVGLPGRVWKTGRARWVPDVTLETNYPRAEVAISEGLHACFLLPVPGRGEVLAVLEFLSEEVRPSDPALLEMLDTFSGQVGQFLERRYAEAELEASERQTRQILETTHDAFVAMDSSGQITDWNPQAEAMFGWRRDEALGRELADTIIPESNREAHRRGLKRFVATGEGTVLGQRLELSAVHRSGRELPVELTISPLKGDAGYSFNAFLRDISERKQFEQRLQHMARRDHLTDLYNRRGLEEELERQLAMARRFNRSGAVLMLDLDDFKAVNDALGHKAGDELLNGIARVLSKRLRSTDTLGRLGGDEFAIVLPEVSAEQAQTVADALQDAIASHTQLLGRERVHVTASIGFVMFDSLQGVEDLLAGADDAMYAAKRGARV
jgi:diguanylate cyclase (GGDEF)-like protein/PAS domain S-box-containing protein